MKKIMRVRSLPILSFGLLIALALVPLAVACGGGREETTIEPGSMGQHMAQAMDHMNAMVAAAGQGDMDAAQAAFERAHDPLHAVIDDLEATNPELAAKLDEAVDDAEKDLAEGADADHIVEIGNQILDLLRQAQ